MIQPEPSPTEPPEVLRSPRELLADRGIAEAALDFRVDHSPDFPFRLPRALAALIRHGDPRDPILRQVLPSLEEREADPWTSTDPLAESRFASPGGIIRKYPGRALLVTTGACAIHCRYCFRRHTDYGATGMGRQLHQAIETLGADSTIREVILSGGDPLALSDHRLIELIHGLEGIGHLDTLRLHSRTATVDPGQLSDALIRVLGASRLHVVLVTHVNHAREIGDLATARLAALRRAGVTLLNQSVLLRGVNDDSQTLAALSRTLFEIGVLPYYLHALDPVAGAAHFRVSDTRALHIMQELRDCLPGYLVPRFVREVPGDASKRPVASVQAAHGVNTP
ncbi:EF-P beta-lysylation protein EpmB [uncultured Abyssibacter sp.]|uniref:EF-P beta-lysylation protein EpmB n=1 Tax=uncultured Abyssibacter sp. TaxID=2320202 RepID=UPI0032B177EB